MKVTARKIEANRRNALKSTGPRTENGKKRSRYNALKHGILAKEVVLPPGRAADDREAFQNLLAGLRDDLEPEGALEEILVEKAASAFWRLGRALRCEAGEVRRNLETAPWRAEAERAKSARYYLANLSLGLEIRGRLLGNPEGLDLTLDLLKEAEEEVRKAGDLSAETRWRLEGFFGKTPVWLPRREGGVEWLAVAEELGDREGEDLLEAVRSVKKRMEALRDLVAERGRAEAEAEMATLSLPGPETRESLVAYERMVEREIYQALRQLERVQRRRKGEFVPPPISIGH